MTTAVPEDCGSHVGCSGGGGGVGEGEGGGGGAGGGDGGGGGGGGEGTTTACVGHAPPCCSPGKPLGMYHTYPPSVCVWVVLTGESVDASIWL